MNETRGPSQHNENPRKRFTPRRLPSFVLLALLALRPVGAEAAFELFPEYSTLSEADAERLPDPRAIDAETESDILAFLTPLSFDRALFSNRGAYDLTLGSLSSRQFLFNQRVRLNAPIGERLSFLFTHVTQENYETERRQNVLELEWKLDSRWSLAAYGEPSGQKEEDDIGLALIFRPEDGHRIRLYHTWTDFTRGDRSIAGDRFIDGRVPNAFGLTGRRIDDDSYLHYSFRAESPARWRFPQFDRDVTSRRLFALLEFLKPVSQTVALESRLQWDESHAGFEPLAPTAPESIGTRRRRLHALIAADLAPEPDGVAYRFGVYAVDREWRMSRPAVTEVAGHRSWLPHAWISWPTTQRAQGRRDKVQVGLESTFFAARGQRELLAESARRDFSIESRANLRYVFELGANASLTLLVSADLDRRDGGGGFEGGNGQFVCTF